MDEWRSCIWLRGLMLKASGTEAPESWLGFYNVYIKSAFFCSQRKVNVGDGISVIMMHSLFPRWMVLFCVFSSGSVIPWWTFHHTAWWTPTSSDRVTQSWIQFWSKNRAMRARVESLFQHQTAALALRVLCPHEGNSLMTRWLGETYIHLGQSFFTMSDRSITFKAKYKKLWDFCFILWCKNIFLGYFPLLQLEWSQIKTLFYSYMGQWKDYYYFFLPVYNHPPTFFPVRSNKNTVKNIINMNKV